MKYFRMSYEEVVFNRSYLNILLLNRSIPSTKFDNDDKNGAPSAQSKPKGRTAQKKSYSHESELFASLM